MPRLLLFLLVLCTLDCRSAPALGEIYESARQSLWRGNLADALARIEGGEREPGAATPEWSWKFRLLRAEVLLLKRDGKAASALLTAGLDAAPRPPAIEARRTYLLAQGQGSDGRVAEAIETLKAARRLADSAGAIDEQLDIDTLHGQMLLRREHWTEANLLLEDVARRAAAGGDAYRTAVARHNLGFGHLLRGKYDEALRLFESVLELKPIEPYTVYASALTNAGVCQARIGHFDKAIEVLTQAVQSHERRGAPAFLGPALGELGTTHLLRNEPRQAMQYLTRAFEVATAANAPDAPIWAGNLAKVGIDLREFDEAERFNREAIRLKTTLKRSTLYNTYYAALIAQGRGQHADARRLYEDVLSAPNVTPGLKWESHDGLAMLALSEKKPQLAFKHFAAALGIIQATRADLLRTEYRVTFLSRVTLFYRNYVGALIGAGESARALEVTDSSRGVVLAERMGGAATEAQTASAAGLVAAAQKSGSIWLSYWLAPGRSYVWVVSGQGITCVALPGAPDIEQLVEAYRTTVERSSADPLAGDRSGDALYAAIVAPVARHVPAGASVRIVPDGALHNVNFETLPVPGTRRHYWIEDVNVAIAPSLALLAANAGRPAGGDARSLLLIGDPTPRLKEFPRLGYAPVEMTAVSKHFDPARTVRQDGDRATPAGFFAARPERFSVIHFTAHGAANRTSPLESAVILAGPAGTDKLYAREVAERTLDADLVTISACRSAGERAYAGEGLIGFAWAFLRAGARQVVAGLWDVDDQSTAALMDSLYAGMTAGETPSAALRAAKLALIAKGGHVARPYYWGPFELFTVTP